VMVSNSTLGAFANSSTNFTIDFAPPLLTITSAASNGVVLSWLSLYAHFLLQTNSDLNTANWQPAVYPVSTNGGVNSVTMSWPAGSLYFRLWNFTGGEIEP
jgi:hypothetical protein